MLLMLVATIAYLTHHLDREPLSRWDKTEKHIKCWGCKYPCTDACFLKGTGFKHKGVK